METPPLTVDVAASFAHRSGPDVRVVLSVNDAPPAAESERLRLRNGKRTLRGPVQRRTTGDGTVLEAAVPVAAPRPNVWTLALVSGEGPTRRVTPLEARLVTGGNQPVALLPGQTPSTRMPAPRPRARTQGVGVTLNPRLRTAMVRTVDGALSVLPESTAARYRRTLSKAGRRILS